MAFLDFLTPGVGSVASALIGGVSSLFGGSQSNAANQSSAYNQYLANMSLQQQQQQYNAEQAAITRDWSSQQAANQEDYTMGNMAQSEYWTQQNAADAQRYTQANMEYAGRINEAAAQKQMDFQAQQAGIQRDYETQMSNTAYQRSVADMKAAGLNPILGVASGGASTPSASAPVGAMGSVSNPTGPFAAGPTGSVGLPSASNATSGLNSVGMPRMEDVITPAVKTAMQGAGLINAYNEATSNIANTQQDTLNKIKQGTQMDAQTGKIQAEARLVDQQTQNAGMEPGRIQSQIASNRASADASESQVGMNAAAGRNYMAQAALADSNRGVASAQAAELWARRDRTQVNTAMDIDYGNLEHPTSQVINPAFNPYSMSGMTPAERAASTLTALGNSNLPASVLRFINLYKQ